MGHSPRPKSNVTSVRVDSFSLDCKLCAIYSVPVLFFIYVGYIYRLLFLCMSSDAGATLLYSSIDRRFKLWFHVQLLHAIVAHETTALIYGINCRPTDVRSSSTIYSVVRFFHTASAAVRCGAAPHGAASGVQMTTRSAVPCRAVPCRAGWGVKEPEHALVEVVIACELLVLF